MSSNDDFATARFTNWFADEPLFARAALVMLLLIPMSLVALYFDQRTLLDVNVWVKPLKFEVSIFLYIGTLALLARWLPVGLPECRSYRIFSRVVVVCIALEMIWIIGAAANGVESHFNNTSKFMAMTYGAMGVIATVLTSASLLYGIVFLSDGNSTLDPVLRRSIGLGLVLTFALTLISAGYLAGQPGHHVGGSSSDAGGVPLAGWSRDGGDLRVAHFLATHAMHVLPLIGFCLMALNNRASAIRGVNAVATLYACAVILTLVIAAHGYSLFPRG